MDSNHVNAQSDFTLPTGSSKCNPVVLIFSPNTIWPISCILVKNVQHNWKKPSIISCFSCLEFKVMGKSLSSMQRTWPFSSVVVIYFPHINTVILMKLIIDCPSTGLGTLHMIFTIYVFTGMCQSYSELHHTIHSKERRHSSYFCIIQWRAIKPQKWLGILLEVIQDIYQKCLTSWMIIYTIYSKMKYLSQAYANGYCHKFTCVESSFMMY